MPPSVKIIVWEEDGAWLGYLQEFPKYWTQGKTLDDLREHLRSLYQDLTGDREPPPRTTGELLIK